MSGWAGCLHALPWLGLTADRCAAPRLTPRHLHAPHQTAGGIILPDSPNSLIERGHKEKGRQILEKIRGTNEVDAGAWSAAVKECGRLGQLLHHALAA